MVITTKLSLSDVTALRSDTQVVKLIDAKDWSGLVEYLNSDGHSCNRDSVTRDFFLLNIAPCGFRIAQLPEIPREGWKLTLSLILSSNSIDVSSRQVQGLLTMGIQQGVITQQEVDKLTLQPSTLAESLLGRMLGQLLTRDDLQAALS